MMTLNKTLLAAATLTLLATGVAPRADDFGGQTSNGGTSVSADQRAANAQDADPTARTSVRSHGHQ